MYDLKEVFIPSLKHLDLATHIQNPSPPSSWVVAMSGMQQQNCKTKHHWNIIETL